MKPPRIIVCLVVTDVVALVGLLWSLLAAPQSGDQVAGVFIWACLFGMPTLVVLNVVVVLAIHARSGDLTPPELTTARPAQFTIGWLMLMIAIAAFLFAPLAILTI